MKTKNEEQEMVPFETAQWLHSIGFAERTRYRYAVQSFELCATGRHVVKKCDVGDSVKYGDCVDTMDFLNHAISAPDAFTASEYIRKKSGLECLVKSDDLQKHFCQLVAYKSIVIMESGVHGDPDEALQEMFDKRQFRKCVENEIEKRKIK